jgi:hypothetical protein
LPLDLLIPDLLIDSSAPEPVRGLRLPWVERWLARADIARVPLRGVPAWLGRAFGLPDPPPVAAVTLAADDAPRPGNWLRADPVHLRVGGDSLSLHDASGFEVTQSEASALVAALQAHFAGDGLEFIAPSPRRWYVRVPDDEVPRTTPLDEAVGRNVFGLLPRGTGSINWPGALTEAQMVLAAHPVNSARLDSGQPPINSVWFWGEGAAPASIESPYALAYSDDPFAHGLARLSGARAFPAAAGFDRVDAVRAEQWVLVVDGRLTEALGAGGEDAWVAAARDLDERWFAHVEAAVGRFEAVRLVLPGPRDTLVATISPRARWRWFRSRKPLATHA